MMDPFPGAMLVFGNVRSVRLLPFGKRRDGNFKSNVENNMHLYICIHGPFSRHVSLPECVCINVSMYMYIQK